MAHTITVEPLTHSLRTQSGHWGEPAHLAIVERRGAGELADVRAITSDYADAYPLAREWAARTGAEVTIMSSYAPTVVGADIAAKVAADPNCQPMPLFTLKYEASRDGVDALVERRDIPAHVVEKIGALANRLAVKGKVWNIEVLDAGGGDVTFDFACFCSEDDGGFEAYQKRVLADLPPKKFIEFNV